MRILRSFLQGHSWLAIMLIAMALAMKALIPAGYMIGSATKVLTVEICSDASGNHLTKQIVIAQDGKPSSGEAEHGKSSVACPFSALSTGALSNTDAALLAVALAFILLLGFASIARPSLENRAYLRPPLRGPPAFA